MGDSPAAGDAGLWSELAHLSHVVSATGEWFRHEGLGELLIARPADVADERIIDEAESGEILACGGVDAAGRYEVLLRQLERAKRGGGCIGLGSLTSEDGKQTVVGRVVGNVVAQGSLLFLCEKLFSNGRTSSESARILLICQYPEGFFH